MARNLLTATFDAALELKDAGAVTASGAAQVGGSARVLNMGNGIFMGVLVIDVDEIDIAGGDEGYDISLQGSTSPTFASDVHILETVTVGDSSVTGESADAGVARYTRTVLNTKDGSTPLPYLRVYHTVAGVTASVNYRAWLTKDPTR